MGLSTQSMSAQGTMDSTATERYSIINVDGIEVIRDSFEKVYISSPVESDGKQLSLLEYKEILEQSDKLSEQLISIDEQSLVQSEQYNAAAVVLIGLPSYEENLGWRATGSKVQVSAWINCPSGGSDCSIASTTQKTFTHEFSANVESGWKDYIRLGASYTWSSQTSTSTTYTLPVKAGKTAYMSFRPWINYTRGYVTTTWYSNGWYAGTTTSDMVFGNGPDMLSNGEANGIYALEYPYE